MHDNNTYCIDKSKNCYNKHKRHAIVFHRKHSAATNLVLSFH